MGLTTTRARPKRRIREAKPLRDWNEYERRKAELRERSYRGEISASEYQIGIQRIVKELEL